MCSVMTAQCICLLSFQPRLLHVFCWWKYVSLSHVVLGALDDLLFEKCPGVFGYSATILKVPPGRPTIPNGREEDKDGVIRS